MTCAEFLERYSEYVDGLAIPPAERREFDRHVAACEKCRRHDLAVRRGVIELRRMAAVAPSQGFRRRLDERLSGVIEERKTPPPILRIAAVLLVAVALAVLTLEGTRRPAAAGPARIEPVPFPHPVAHTAPPFVSFQDPRVVVLAGSMPLYGAAVARTPVSIGGDVTGR